MKVNLHNKVEIFLGENHYVFYNEMYDNVLEKIANFEPFTEHVAVGNGMPSNNKITQKLTNFIKKYSLKSEILQNNLENGTLFSKKALVLNESELSNENITEIGFCDEDNNIYNYITLISEDTPSGIHKNYGEKMVIFMYVYLSLTKSGEGFLSSGNNPLLSLFLGEGMTSQIYALRGNNLTENILINREKPLANNSVLTSVETRLNGHNLELSFSADLGEGECDEIVFLTEENVIGRLNVLNQKPPISNIENRLSKNNNIIDIGESVKEVVSLKNLSSNQYENDFAQVLYASEFGDKISVPFKKIFDYKSPRFLSKDSKFLFFVLDNFVYCFKNENYQLKEISTGNLSISHISKIISFENFVFIISRVEPFLHCYFICDDVLRKVDFDISNIDIYPELKDALKFDIVKSENGTFMLACILKTGVATVIYFLFDENENKFVYDCYLQRDDYEYSYLFALQKNNFSDAFVCFFKEGEASYNSKKVTFYPNKTMNGQDSVLAYDYTHNTKEIYALNRAVIVEKTTLPKVFIYYYPNEEIYNLPLLNDEVDDYFSNDLYYLIQKYANGSYKIFTLSGYLNPIEFKNGFSDYVDINKIKDFQFLDDTLLIFLDDEDEPIVALNLKKSNMLIENVNASNTNYQVEFNTYNKLGINEGVRAILKIDINI